MFPKPAIDIGEKAPSRPLLRFGGGQKPVLSIECVSPCAARVCVTEVGQGQAYLVAGGGWGRKATESIAAAYEGIAQELKKRQLHILHERVFGSLALWPTVRSVRRRVLQSQGLEADGPLSYVQGQPSWGKGLSGAIIRAVRAPKGVRAALDNPAPWLAGGPGVAATGPHHSHPAKPSGLGPRHQKRKKPCLPGRPNAGTG